MILSKGRFPRRSADAETHYRWSTGVSRSEATDEPTIRPPTGACAQTVAVVRVRRQKAVKCGSRQKPAPFDQDITVLVSDGCRGACLRPKGGALTRRNHPVLWRRRRASERPDHRRPLRPATPADRANDPGNMPEHGVRWGRRSHGTRGCGSGLVAVDCAALLVGGLA
jgi:hypothetical protein